MYIVEINIINKTKYKKRQYTVYPSRIDTFFIISYDIKWIKSSWTYGVSREAPKSKPHKY